MIRYNAATVPILDLGLSSDTLTEQEEYDLGYNFIRTQLANIEGASIPLPYGGRPKQVMVDINPAGPVFARAGRGRRHRRTECAKPDPAHGLRRESARANTAWK